MMLLVAKIHCRAGLGLILLEPCCYRWHRHRFEGACVSLLGRDLAAHGAHLRACGSQLPAWSLLPGEDAEKQKKQDSRS
jgi:hypothetical protein